MQEPAVAFAVDPDEGRIARAGDEVVALRLVAVPPAAFDALRPREQLEVHAPEAARRLQQPGGALPRLGEVPRVPVAGLDPPPRIFRAMVRIRRQAVNRPAAEPRLQPLGELA